MHKELRIQVWLLLLTMLLGGLFLMAFGWSIKSTLAGSTKSGRFGKAAVQMASFPTKARWVFSELKVDIVEAEKLFLTPTIDIDLSQFDEVSSVSGIDLQGLLVRADSDYIESARYWRILVGAFTIDGELKNSAIALNPDLKVVKTWILSEENIPDETPRASHRQFVHGFDVLNDGSVIFTVQSVSLQRFDLCGNRIWAIPGEYHHSVTLDEDQKYVWTLIPNGIAKVATADGTIERQFLTDEIIRANPTLDILQIRQEDDDDLGDNSRNTIEKWLPDQIHLNDVDPLPSSLLDKFPGFETDDLLISARSLNLVFVVDPDTLEVKWWRMGATRRQHDPDWSKDGKITIFDNRMSSDYSRIISLAPDTFEVKTILDGKVSNFYSRIRGKHQIIDNGTVIVASTQQGRVFEADPAGDIRLEILNIKPGSTESSYAMSQAIILSDEASHFLVGERCSG